MIEVQRSIGFSLSQWRKHGGGLGPAIVMDRSRADLALGEDRRDLHATVASLLGQRERGVRVQRPDKGGEGGMAGWKMRREQTQLEAVTLAALELELSLFFLHLESTRAAAEDLW